MAAHTCNGCYLLRCRADARRAVCDNHAQNESHECPHHHFNWWPDRAQRGWITSEEGRVLEDVFVSNAKQIIYFLGRPRMVEESGNSLVASPFQPLFHVRHAVGGSEQVPLNLWDIVLLTDAPDPRYCEPFKQMVRAGLLPGFIEIYIERDLKLKLSRI